jgi:hypothetical protein
VRIEHVQQRFGKLRKIIIDLEPEAAGDEGEGLDQSAGVGVVDRVGGQPQAPGDLRMCSSELACQALNIFEFLIVVSEQAIRHRRAPSPKMYVLPGPAPSRARSTEGVFDLRDRLDTNSQDAIQRIARLNERKLNGAETRFERANRFLQRAEEFGALPLGRQ